MSKYQIVAVFFCFFMIKSKLICMFFMSNINNLVCFKLQAVELLKRIGEFSAALEIVNQCLSDTIAAMASGRSDGDTKSSGLILAGNEILDAYKVVGVGRSVY